MPRRKEPKQRLVPVEIRRGVNHIMARAEKGEYHSFCELFNALLKANNGMHISDLVDTLNNHRGEEVYNRAVLYSYHNGEVQPRYEFIADLLNSGNPLNLDPKLIKPGGKHRELLFAAAGITEVTPKSTSRFNKDLLHEAARCGDAKPHWASLIHDMIAFQTQHHRTTVEEIQNEIFPDSATPGRLARIIQKVTSPTPDEEKRIYKFLGLSNQQRNLLQNPAFSRELKPAEASPFSQRLDGILTHLAEQDISARRLAELSARLSEQPLPGRHARIPPITDHQLGTLRHGETHPAINTLRSLVHVLENVRKKNGYPPPQDIDALVEATEFKRDDLFATPADFIKLAQGDSSIGIQTLLHQLRTSLEINVDSNFHPIALSEDKIPAGQRPFVNTRLERTTRAVPNHGAVEKLLNYFSAVMQARGHASLSDKDKATVLAIARRDYAAAHASGRGGGGGTGNGHRARLAQQRQERREELTPGGP